MSARSTEGCACGSPRAAGTHDAGEAERALRRSEGQALRDHAAHGGADDVGLGNAQRVQHAERIVGHVLHAVGWVDGQAQAMLDRGQQHVGRTQMVKVLTEANVAVVQPNDAMACVHQALHQRARPGDQLHAQAHDEQHRYACATGVFNL